MTAQQVFSSTGGLHAAGLFNAAGSAPRRARGRRAAQRGRQDRRLGAAARQAPAERAARCWSSGRASFELVQKAVLAGIPLLAAVSAPSSLAADLAEEAGLTLVGFLRGPSMNVYTGAERLAS